MGYAESPTVTELSNRVQTNLATEDVENAGRDIGDICEKLNEAAREVALEVLRLNQATLLFSRDYTVNAGDADIALPDGSETQYPRWRRIVGVWRIDGPEPIRLTVIDERESEEQPCVVARDSYRLIRENLKLRFAASGGAPAAMTIRLKYIAGPAECARGAMNAKPFELLPAEWIDAIVDLATAKLIPAAKMMTAQRYEASARRRLETLRKTDSRPVHTGTRYVRRCW